MADNKGAVIFLAIIAVGALGLSSYMFTMDLLAEPPVEEPSYILVGLWDQLTQNTADNPSHQWDNNFLVEFADNIVLNPTYLNNISNTRFGFNVAGIYKISLKVLFNGLVAGQTCWIHLQRNGSNIEDFGRIDMPSPAPSQFYPLDASIYINATTDVYYEINPASSLDFWHVGDTSTLFNQLAIEYCVM